MFKNYLIIAVRHLTRHKLFSLINVIAWPIAYALTEKWLENYAYHIHQHLTTFILSGIALFIVSFILIAVQCLKTAGTNPVKNLRTE